MSIRSFCGPFQPALEDAFAERVRELAAERRPFAVVAPSRRMAERLQRLLALERGLPLLGGRFHTFHSLALEALQDVRYGGRLISDGLFHDKVVDRLLSARRPGRRTSRGLAAAYRSSIRDLVDCGLDPALFREHFGELLEGSPDRLRFDEVLCLQEEYLASLAEAGILPPAGITRLATAAVESGESTALGRYAELLYYGFYDLTGSQSDFFQAVGRAYPVRVFFPYRKGHPGYQFADRFYELKLHTGGEPPTLLEGRPSPALGPVLDALSAPGRSTRLPDPGALTLVSVSGGYDEAWAAAKEILRLRVERGLPYEEIGVVARSLDDYRSVVAEVFHENGIPFWMEADDPLLRHPVAKLCLSLLQLRRREFPVQAVLDILGSRYFRAGRAAPGRDPRSLRSNWKRLVERLGIRGGWMQWEGLLSRWAREDLELDARPGEGGRGDSIPKEDTALLWQWLIELNGRLQPAARGWAALADHARRLLEETFAVDGEDGPEKESWAAVMGALESLTVFELAWPGARWEEFLDVLEERLRRASLGSPSRRRGVRVLGAMDARGESFRALILLGLQEGVFPRQVREDPLLPDGVRLMLQKDAGYWILPKRSGYDEERLLFHLLLASASESLTCVFQRSDDEGKALVPSLYLRELCQACGLDLETAARRLPRQPIAKLEELLAARPWALSPKELSLLLAARGRGTAPLAPLAPHLPAFGEHRLLEGCVAVVGDLNRDGEPGRLDGITGPLPGFLRGLDARGLSPTALQTFRQCPFRFFASRLLRLPDDSEPAEPGDLGARVRGELYHRILERFYPALSAAGFWAKPEDGAWRAALERCAAEVLPSDGWRSMGVHPLLWRALRERMRRHLERFLARDIADILACGLIPRLFEHPLRVSADGLRLRGTLDRVDVDARKRLFRVVDYKSRAGDRRLETAVRSMRRIQPPLYLELMRGERSLAPSVAEPRGAFFYLLEESRETTGTEPFQEFSREAWQELREPLLANIREYRRMMGRGLFFIAPEDGRGRACSACSFGAVCRKSHRASRRRAERSSLRRRFDEHRRIHG